MFPDSENTYPGRKFIQALQVGLVAAIVVFSVMALSRPRSETPVETVVAPTVAPFETAAPRPTTAAPTALPDNSALRIYDRAAVEHDLKNYDEAIDLYTQALELDPTMTSGWLGRAVAYEQMGANARLSRNDFARYVQYMETDRVVRDITSGKSLELEMTEGLVYALSFDVQSGDKVEITADSTVNGEPGDEGVVDPLILLYDSEGTLVQANDDTLRSDGTLINMNSSIENYRGLHTGTYTLILTHAGGGSFGDIDLTVTVR